MRTEEETDGYAARLALIDILVKADRSRRDERNYRRASSSPFGSTTKVPCSTR